MMAYELIPIGTILSLLAKQVVKTADAAKDVLVEKESFKALSKHLSDIEPVLRELQHRELKDTEAAREALGFLEDDIRKANHLVEKYKNRARFYLLLKCRHIVKEVQVVTNDIGKSLDALSVAGVEVLTGISEQVTRLHIEMQRAEFETSQSHVRIVQKLDDGLRKQKVDQGFANDILEEIAKAVGVSIKPSEISKEIASFKREILDAAECKNREEEYFLKQVIELLSRADAAKDHKEIKKHYFQRVKAIEKIPEEYIAPFKSFICPIERRDVMVDPVSLCTGTSCEKAAIEAWFARGKKVDPKTGEPLDDVSLRDNHQLRKSIEEWRELNYCLKIRSIKRKLQSGTSSIVEEDLIQMQEIMTENPITKDWISIEGLTVMCLSILESSHKNIKRRVLMVLKSAVQGHISNKEKVIASQEIHQIVPCLGRSLDVSEPAVELLYDLLQDCNGWNLSAYRKLSEECSAIFLYLVILMNKKVEKAKTILLELCNDDDNVIQAAKCNWYEPLIVRLVQGSESSRISMVKSLRLIEFSDLHLRCLGQEGAIPPLLEMASGNIESKELAMCALIKLSVCRENKRLFADAGGVPLILDTLKQEVRSSILAKCCEILERLSSNDDGTDFLVGADGSMVALDEIVTYLLAIQENAISHTVRKPSLCALLGICKSAEKIVMKTIGDANGVSVILPLLDHVDEDIREVSLNLLFRFSQHDPQGIVEFLLFGRRLDRFLCFLEDDSRRGAQTAAVGLLANLPKSETELTKRLIESNAIPAILEILKSGTVEAKENALGALFRFTDPENLESQRLVVELGLYPLLVSFLRSGTTTAKARAAALIGNLSSSTPQVTIMPKSTNIWRFMNTSKPICEAHGIICSVTTTFCILKANALPELVKLLHEKHYATTYEVLQALLTLVCGDRYHRGAKVLHKVKAISPILEVLKWGMPSLQMEALHILEKVFMDVDMVEVYGAHAKHLLFGLTTRRIHEDDQLKRKAARVLSLLQGYSRSSMPLA